MSERSPCSAGYTTTTGEPLDARIALVASTRSIRAVRVLGGLHLPGTLVIDFLTVPTATFGVLYAFSCSRSSAGSSCT